MLRSRRGWNPEEGLLAAAVVSLACTGVAFAYAGYSVGISALNPDELVGAGLFWAAVTFLALAFPLRAAVRTFIRYVTTPAGGAIFVAYITVHLLLYGFLLEGILAGIYGTNVFAVPAGFFVSTNLFLPVSLANVLFDVAFNPSIVMTIPPLFSAALSFYSMSAALLIGVLVVANVGKVKELGRLSTAGGRARAFVLLPAAGVVFGASCCLSVAGVLSLLSPTASVVFSNLWLYYGTYFLLPVVAMALLYVNLVSVAKIAAGVGSPRQTGPSWQVAR